MLSRMARAPDSLVPGVASPFATIPAHLSNVSDVRFFYGDELPPSFSSDVTMNGTDDTSPDGVRYLEQTFGVMQQILQQAQTDPSALQDHMKNPMIKQKIMKLINAGIIRTR